MPTTRQRVAMIAMQAGEQWSAGKVDRIVQQINQGDRTATSVYLDVLARLGRPVDQAFLGRIEDRPPGDFTTQAEDAATAAQATPTQTQPPTPQGPSRADFAVQARALYPWIPAALLDVFVDAWVEHGDPNMAMAALRADSRYGSFFPGNRREDGTVRNTESEYLSTFEAYRRDTAAYGIDPGSLQDKFVELYENGVSAREWRENRLAPLYVDIISKSDQIRAFYAQTVGATSVSDTALLWSALDGKTPAPVFEQRIRTAQVGGTASEFGFTRTVSEAERLSKFGLDERAARSLYSQAAEALPTLSALSARFGDPNDPLTIEDYEDALVVRDADELATLGRLVRQGNVEFGGLGVARDQAGNQRGLLSR